MRVRFTTLVAWFWKKYSLLYVCLRLHHFCWRTERAEHLRTSTNELEVWSEREWHSPRHSWKSASVTLRRIIHTRVCKVKLKERPNVLSHLVSFFSCFRLYIKKKNNFSYVRVVIFLIKWHFEYIFRKKKIPVET